MKGGKVDEYMTSRWCDVNTSLRGYWKWRVSIEVDGDRLGTQVGN